MVNKPGIQVMTVSLERVTRNPAGKEGQEEFLEGRIKEPLILHSGGYFEKWRWELGECTAYFRWASGNTG